MQIQFNDLSAMRYVVGNRYVYKFTIKISQRAKKFKKNIQLKKLVKSNKSISQKNFLDKFHFLQFQK